MVTLLAAAAVAALLWPHGPARRRARLRRLSPAAGRARAWPPVPRRGSPAGAAAVAGLAVGGVLSTPLVAGLAALLGALAGRAWTRHRHRASDGQRLLALARGLGALAADLRSGRRLDAAVDAAAASCGDERAGAALVRAVRSPGRPLPDAAAPGLDGPLARVSGAVELSARTGCSLAEVLATVEDELRARHRHDLELRAATAGPRAGALLLAGLPVLGLAMGSGVGADPWHVLTATGTGQVLLVSGVALEVAGVAWSTRLVRRALR